MGRGAPGVAVDGAEAVIVPEDAATGDGGSGCLGPERIWPGRGVGGAVGKGFAGILAERGAGWPGWAPCAASGGCTGEEEASGGRIGAGRSLGALSAEASSSGANAGSP